jgi:Ca2+-transporting ATPase
MPAHEPIADAEARTAADDLGVRAAEGSAGPAPHAASADEVLARLDSGRSGLSEADAADRLRQYGPNRLEAARPVSALRILVGQLRSVVVGLLVAAAAIALILGEPVEAAAIGAVLVINTAIGFVTELRARRAMSALLRLDVPRASVVRDGQLRAVNAHVLVPGDLIEINAGQHVPADGRILEATDVQTNEASLTGESLPVSKSADAAPADAALADRASMVYKGTTVAAGTARVLVTATGGATELGRIGALVAGVREEPTPLEKRLNELGHRLVWLALGVAGLVAALGAAQGVPLALVIETGIALAVAAVPEALPAVATIALAVGVHRMARRHALVRRLPAVESLGSTTVVCTDKTRTLTSGQMTAVRLWTESGELDLTDAGQAVLPAPARKALRVASRASRAQARRGDGDGTPADPVDAALLRAAERAGVSPGREVGDGAGGGTGDAHDEGSPIGLLPFSSERKLMASFHREDGRVVAYVKGAPRRLLALSGRGPAGEPLTDEGRRTLIAANDALAMKGLRVIALASGPVAAPAEDALRDLTFTGYIGLMDPPAPGVRETIARLQKAGLRTVMLTGDQRLTAEAVGRELGVLTGDADLLGGAEIDAMPPAEFEARVARTGTFSRISPEHKLRIVGALQARGEIVAMLGDGVNDAAALKKADIGVAMGQRGTDIAKDAADVVLADDRFATIGAAVEEGRVIYDNIRKFVFYLFSCNVAEVLVLLVAGIVGLPQPLMPLQILWLNVITDTFPALSLAVEPAEEGTMARPPRDPDESMLSRVFLGWIGGYAVLITAATLTAYLVTLHGESAERARTVAFMTLALAQAAHLVNAQSSSMAVEPRRLGANRWAIGALALVIVLQGLALYVPPLASVLQVTPLSLAEWGIVVPCALAPALGGLLLGVVRRRRR